MRSITDAERVTPKQKVRVNDFLKAKSMATPGVVAPAHPAVTHPVKAERFFRPWLGDQAAARAQRILVVTPTP